jgi:hypothetical protein
MATKRKSPVCSRCTDAIEQFAARMDTVEESTAILREQHGALMASMSDLKVSVQKQHDIITKYKGWIGGALFVVSGVFMVLSFIKEWIIRN